MCLISSFSSIIRLQGVFPYIKNQNIRIKVHHFSVMIIYIVCSRFCLHTNRTGELTNRHWFHPNNTSDRGFTRSVPRSILDHRCYDVGSKVALPLYVINKVNSSNDILIWCQIFLIAKFRCNNYYGRSRS